MVRPDQAEFFGIDRFRVLLACGQQTRDGSLAITKEVREWHAGRADLVEHRFLPVTPGQPAELGDEVADRAAMMPLVFVTGDVCGNVPAKTVDIVPMRA